MPDVWLDMLLSEIKYFNNVAQIEIKLTSEAEVFQSSGEINGLVLTEMIKRWAREIIGKFLIDVTLALYKNK